MIFYFPGVLVGPGWNDMEGTALMKSFERGHTEERIDASEFLTALASEQKNATT